MSNHLVLNLLKIAKRVYLDKSFIIKIIYMKVIKNIKGYIILLQIIE